jgi:hypothetical protein
LLVPLPFSSTASLFNVQADLRLPMWSSDLPAKACGRHGTPKDVRLGDIITIALANARYIWMIESAVQVQRIFCLVSLWLNAKEADFGSKATAR